MVSDPPSQTFREALIVDDAKASSDGQAKASTIFILKEFALLPMEEVCPHLPAFNPYATDRSKHSGLWPVNRFHAGCDSGYSE
jgi:hypothetical protein